MKETREDAANDEELARNKTYTRKLLDENDKVITSRKGIANTFARG